jgi:hypothetical protein
MEFFHINEVCKSEFFSCGQPEAEDDLATPTSSFLLSFLPAVRACSGACLPAWLVGCPAGVMQDELIVPLDDGGPKWKGRMDRCSSMHVSRWLLDEKHVDRKTFNKRPHVLGIYFRRNICENASCMLLASDYFFFLFCAQLKV